MPRHALKSGVYISLAAILVVSVAHDAQPMPFSLDFPPFERIQDPAVWQPSPDMMIRLRPSTRNPTGRSQFIDADVFRATPGGHPISDTYDFTGLETERRPPITPVEPSRIHKTEPEDRGVKPRRRSNEVLHVGIKTLDNVVTAMKIFVENVSRILQALM